MTRSGTPSTTRRALVGALPCLAILAGCATPSMPPAGARAALAPTGELRVALIAGSPMSLVATAPVEEMRGVSVDLGRSLAGRLGVPVKFVVYPRLPDSLAAVRRGDADLIITNATPERAATLDFASTLVDLELGVLVPPTPRITSIDGIDQSGFVIGVSQGSTSERTLGGRFRLSKVRGFPSLAAAREALITMQVDGFATNKAVLHELGERVPGSRVLEGRWGTEHFAAALPKGRDAAGLAYLRMFTDEVRRNGELQRAADRAGLKGMVK
ncbi:transporter substrate-binding domain-containing protein [Ramlibacter sp.]|uniref:transporter substrate-binding domain-containing protein n=1 Tax=Ramlibacter sp. TaxID=1917967 RepID=UPI003D0E7D12